MNITVKKNYEKKVITFLKNKIVIEWRVEPFEKLAILCIVRIFFIFNFLLELGFQM